MTQHVGHRSSDEIARLNDELDRLRAENERLREELAKAEQDKVYLFHEAVRCKSVMEGQQAELGRLRAEVTELVTFVKAYRNTEHPSYLWSLSTALLDKHAPPDPRRKPK